MTRKRRTISDTLRQAIANYGTLYQVAKDSGISWSVLQRFQNGERDLRLATADKLAQFFRLELREG